MLEEFGAKHKENFNTNNQYINNENIDINETNIYSVMKKMKNNPEKGTD